VTKAKHNFNQLLQEAIEGLPTSMDPYAPSQRDGTQPSPDSKIDDTEPPSPQGVTKTTDKLDDTLDDKLDDTLDTGLLQPTRPTWKPLRLPNKKDLAFTRSDGFKLRLRKVESVPGKWLAQLWKDEEVLEYGQISIPDNVKPAEYIQKMADYMLDANSNRYEQEETEEQSAADFAPEPKFAPMTDLPTKKEIEAAEVSTEPAEDVGTDEELPIDDIIELDEE
jgi:hypothetical protein